MSINLQEAIKNSLYTEKSAMDFYLLAAQRIADPEARRIFELLAREERQHAGSFYDMYTGNDLPDFDIFMAAIPEQGSGWSAALGTLLDSGFTAQQALELAMEKEQQLESVLRTIAASIAIPEVRAVFERNADETRNHYLMIESEYARLMGMVHETDLDTYVRE
ncbi:ferritin-like domain-containing protein [Trichlorobacter ammonificans]|uniref:Ferritin n=1 Tax=Trichlorobacter ammonificans TaxID=2916410 RepID=A0ABM9D8U2_9BACT|nr:ferritin family protein [Trichlorobacter ammonificans]CAH2031608.1 Ferritin [Trichlorobacter ammonificans]